MDQNFEKDKNTIDNPNKNGIIIDSQKKEEEGSVQEEYHVNEQNKIADKEVKKNRHPLIDNFINRVENKNPIYLEDFNLYKNIKTNNEISPLMIFILENAINKYNNNLDQVDAEFENVGFGDFPGIKVKERDNNKAFFDSLDAFVLYATFSEKFIANFWANHQLLADLLGVNPDKTVLSSKLHLGKSKRSQSNSSNSQEKFEDKTNKNIEDIDNENYYKLTLGASFEYNALHFLLYGIKEFINFPRIVYYPIVNFMDYEEIDSVFLIKQMKDNLDAYYSNFKSIDLTNIKGERKQFNLKENDLVFVETSFDFQNKNDKISDFMLKIIKFINLFINANLIQNLDQYTIKPIVLYNNNFYLSDKNIKNIKKSIKVVEDTIASLDDKTKIEKFKEIISNIQIIYCWPTIPIFNNITTYNDLNKKIENETNDLRNTIVRLENENRQLKNIVVRLENKNTFLEGEIKRMQNQIDIMKKNNNYNNHHNYKRFNNNNYNYKKYKYNNYKPKYNSYYYQNNDYKYVNNTNQRYKRDYKYNYNNNYSNNYY